MRSTLLVSTAALLAGIGLASAQGMQGGQSGAAPSAQSQGAQGGAAGQERQSPQSSPSQRGGQAQQKEPMQKDNQAQRDQGAPAKAGQDDKAQPQRSGQGQRDQQSPAQAQSPQRQDNQRGGQAAQGEGSQGSKTLTTEQRTTIRNTVVAKGPRATNVNFSVSVGTTVPTSVRVVAVPSTLIEIYPEWRGHMYFVVNDEIIIVDSNHRIIAVLPV
jgi:Protein of unknown function (DUF1236)